MSKVEQKNISFEEGWNFVQKAIKNILEGLPGLHFTSDDFLMLYTTIYSMSTQKPPNDYSQQLYDKYNEAFEDYINSTVLPSLREKKDELLLRELLVRWSNHRIMTRLLSGIFNYIDRHYTSRKQLPSLEEASYLSFYSLVSDEIPLIASSSFMDNTPKDEKMHDSTTTAVSSQKINLISSDGEVFEVNYDVAVMSKTLKDAIEANSAGDINSISLSLVKSEMLTKVIEYCKKHSSTQMSGVDLRDWNAKFVEVDPATLFGLVPSANYLTIKRLLHLVCVKVADMIKQKSPSEIRRFFAIEEEYNN